MRTKIEIFRVTINERVTILLAESDHPMDATAINISTKGILLQLESHLDANSLFQLYLPKALGEINVIARVIWQQGDHFGCNFADISEELRGILDQVVSAHLRRN